MWVSTNPTTQSPSMVLTVKDSMVFPGVVLSIPSQTWDLFSEGVLKQINHLFVCFAPLVHMLLGYASTPGFSLRIFPYFLSHTGRDSSLAPAHCDSPARTIQGPS